MTIENTSYLITGKESSQNADEIEIISHSAKIIAESSGKINQTNKVLYEKETIDPLKSDSHDLLSQEEFFSMMEMTAPPNIDKNMSSNNSSAWYDEVTFNDDVSKNEKNSDLKVPDSNVYTNDKPGYDDASEGTDVVANGEKSTQIKFKVNSNKDIVHKTSPIVKTPASTNFYFKKPQSDLSKYINSTKRASSNNHNPVMENTQSINQNSELPSMNSTKLDVMETDNEHDSAAFLNISSNGDFVPSDPRSNKEHSSFENSVIPATNSAAIKPVSGFNGSATDELIDTSIHIERKANSFLNSYGNRLVIDTKNNSILERQGAKQFQDDAPDVKSLRNRLIIDTRNNAVLEANSRKPLFIENTLEDYGSLKNDIPLRPESVDSMNSKDYDSISISLDDTNSSERKENVKNHSLLIYKAQPLGSGSISNESVPKINKSLLEELKKIPRIDGVNTSIRQLKLWSRSLLAALVGKSMKRDEYVKLISITLKGQAKAWLEREIPPKIKLGHNIEYYISLLVKHFSEPLDRTSEYLTRFFNLRIFTLDDLNEFIKLRAQIPNTVLSKNASDIFLTSIIPLPLLLTFQRRGLEYEHLAGWLSSKLFSNTSDHKLAHEKFLEQNFRYMPETDKQFYFRNSKIKTVVDIDNFIYLKDRFSDTFSEREVFQIFKRLIPSEDVPSIQNFEPGCVDLVLRRYRQNLLSKRNSALVSSSRSSITPERPADNVNETGFENILDLVENPNDLAIVKPIDSIKLTENSKLSSKRKRRSFCNFCKKYSHDTSECLNLAKRRRK